MAVQDELQRRLLELLARIGFDRRYYAFYEAARRTATARCNYEAFFEVLSSATRGLKHIKKERFFEFREEAGPWTFTLKLAYLHSRLELILYIGQGGESIGGVVPKLAREAAQVRGPAFTPEPLSPKLPFGDKEQLRAAVEFAFSLYEEVKAAVLAEGGWPVE